MVQKPRGLLAIPVVEESGMVFLQLLTDHKPQLESAAGDSILWRPIGPPGWCDERYRKMRSARLKARDEADAERYRQECIEVGGRDLRDRQEFEKVPERFGLQGYKRPLIGFIAAPDIGGRAVLEIDVRMLDTPERKRKLGTILCDRITETEISRFSEDGIYTAESLVKLQTYLDRVRAEIDQYLESDIAESIRPPRPLLTLKTSTEDEAWGGKYVARLVGSGPFQGIDKIIGARQFFFLYLLFESEEERRIGEVERTVVTESRAVSELLDWAKSGYIKLQGIDRKNPSNRVIKMWGEFTRQMEKLPPMRGMFERIKMSPSVKEPIYTIKIGRDQSQILIANIHALLARGRSITD